MWRALAPNVARHCVPVDVPPPTLRHSWDLGGKHPELRVSRIARRAARGVCDGGRAALLRRSNTCLLKLRQFGELLAQRAAANVGLRVEKALKKTLASQPWTAPQRKWLERIGKQMKVETVVDRTSLDEGAFREEAGGFERLNKRFEGKLEGILGDLREAVWSGVG